MSGAQTNPSLIQPGTRLLELTPEDMTVTVESGITLAALQSELSAHGQWLPIDPPGAQRISIRELLANDLSGPRRFGCGTIREHLIGIKVVLPDGRLIHSGGKVVKNVAGYDLAKLFIGARDTLGTILEATFKLRPVPEVESFVGARVGKIADAGQMTRAVLQSELTPVVLDWHREEDGSVFLVTGFAGTQAEVEWQLEIARSVGITAEANLNYEAHFWTGSAPVHRASVLPTKLGEFIAELGSRSFVARAGNGVVYFRGARMAPRQTQPTVLMRRVKHAYDPHGLLPEYSA
jgi:glycolate oxidase FAD binding subunit